VSLFLEEQERERERERRREARSIKEKYTAAATPPMATIHRT